MKTEKPRGATGPRRAGAASRPSPSRTVRAEPRTAPIGPSARIDVGSAEPPEHVFRRLLGAYLGGASEFVVRESPRLRPATVAVVGTFCRRTRRPEIVADDGVAIRAVDFALDGGLPLERRLAEMGRQVIEFHREAVASWSYLPLGDDGFWERRDDEVDREAWYLERCAARRIGAPGATITAFELWTIARSLERVADHAVILGEEGRRLAGLPHAGGPIATLTQFHAQAMEHLEGVLRVADGGAANELLDTGEAILASGRAITDRLLPTGDGARLSPAAAGAVARIVESIGRTVAYAQDIAQVALDRALEVAPDAPAELPPA